MSQPLYVVMGQEGEYSDHNTWPVRAFARREAAMEHVMKATARAREIAALAQRLGLRWDDPQRSNEFDPGSSPYGFDGLERDPDGEPRDGARYYIMEVPLDDDVRYAIADAVQADVDAGRLRPRRALAIGGLAATDKEEA